MDEHFAPLVDSCLAGCRDGFGLGFVARSEALVAGTPNSPTTLSWHYVLILGHMGRFAYSQVTRSFSSHDATIVLLTERSIKYCILSNKMETSFHMKNLGPRLVALRAEQNLSLSELARLSGVSKSLIHRIENQENANPELGTIRKIARALGTTSGDLLGSEVVQSVRQLPKEHPEWLKSLTMLLRKKGREPDRDLLEALYVLQNRKGQADLTDDDWLYLYHTLERSFNR